MNIQPYLFFEGRCEEAIQFYREALGAKLEMMMRYKDAPPGTPPTAPQLAEKIMHASLVLGQTTFNLADGGCDEPMQFKGFSLALRVADESTAGRIFASLSVQGTVRMPMMKTFFSPSFGMVTDRFGVTWMIMVGE